MKKIILIVTFCVSSLIGGFLGFETPKQVEASNFLKMAEARLCFGGRRYYTECTGWGAGCNPHSCDQGNNQ